MTAAVWRATVHEVRHLGAIRLERLRPAQPDAVEESYGAMAEVLAGLTWLAASGEGPTPM